MGDSARSMSLSQHVTHVLELPPRLLRSSQVSVELRYGTCLEPRAPITSARLLSERLMLCASRRRVGSAAEPEALSRSEPARSTRLSVASHDSPVVHRPLTRSMKTLWLRLDRWFISVAATARRFLAEASSWYTWDGPSTGTVTVFVIIVRSFSCRISYLCCPSPSRS